MKKRICLLSTSNLKHMTLSSLYTDFMDKNNIEYDIIYIDKYHEIESSNAKNVYRYELFIKKEWSFVRKLAHYWKFKKYAKKILIENNYDFIIVWNEFTTFMFADTLKKYFPNKFSVNIRDYHHNNLFFVFKRLEKAIFASSFSTISSEAFRPHLPKFDYTMIHSRNSIFLDHLIPRNKLCEKNKPLEILYIGYMNFPENAFRVIDQLGNDERYLLKFIGAGTEPILEYLDGKNINNVIVGGKFEPSKTPDLLKTADIMYALYDVGNPFVDTAISIKLYYASYLNIPILVFKGTYMDQISSEIGIGFSISKGDYVDLGDRLYDWYHALSIEEMSEKRSKFMEEINNSHHNLAVKMTQHLK